MMAGSSLAIGAAMPAVADGDYTVRDADFTIAERARLLPQYGNLDTWYGNLDTWYGNLDTWYGNLDTWSGQAGVSYGNLDTWYGNLDTWYGNLDTWYGNLDTWSGETEVSYGNLDTWYGNLDTWYGNLDTWYGNLDTWYGNLDTWYGNLDTWYGNLDTWSGDASVFYGNLDTWYGNLDTWYGNLDTWQGDAEGSYGNLDTWYGNLDTWYGNLDTWYGNLDTWDGTLAGFYGNLDTWYGNLDTWWGGLSTCYGNLDTWWGGLGEYGPETEADYEKLLSGLGTMYRLSEDNFALMVGIQTQQDFWNGYAKGVFEKYGIDPTDASTLANLSNVERKLFFMDWRDGLMQFSGIDQIDHWMGAVNWSPTLTADHDYKSKAVIGLLDFGVTDETLFTHDVIYNGGYDTGADDIHGSAVVSLMIAPQDGKGVMGIAPNASVAIYNPFDETKTAGWEDIETGIRTLIDNDARIINMSLGVANTVLSEEWSSILGSIAEDSASEGTVFIKASGNTGSVQLENVEWESAEALSRLIIVGATGIDGNIASWSNTPGEACVTFDGACDEANKLKYNFLVAPGEFLLVSDGAGGVTRQFGTSFAAPLVSGTAALIHGAWPWWKDYGAETVDVILQSATDLGEEGVDSVYGWGMLNVEGALSPLDWNDLEFFYAKNEDGRLKHGKSAKWMQKTYLKSDVVKLQKKGAYVVGLEQVGETFRDFRIPLSTELYDQTTDYDGMVSERKFQRHLHQRFVDWATGESGFGDVRGYTADLTDKGDWTLAMTAAPYVPGTDVRDGQLPFQTDIVLAQAETGTEMRFGYGDGAARLNQSKVFGFYSDFDVESGGVNPILGLASGGTYASSQMPLSDRLSITASVTETSHDHSYIDPLTDLRMDAATGLADYAAQAAGVSLAYQASDRLRVNLDYTQLNERDSLLGDQGAGILAFEGGAVTDAVTMSAEAELPYGFAFGLSATRAETRADQFNGGFLSVSEGGLTSTAFALGLSKTGVFGDLDRARLSLSQPLQLRGGSLNFTALEVIDRQTGELGQVTQNWALETNDQRLMLEAVYATELFDGAAELSGFSRAELTSQDVTGQETAGFVFGGRLAFTF